MQFHQSRADAGKHFLSPTARTPLEIPLHSPWSIESRPRLSPGSGRHTLVLFRQIIARGNVPWRYPQRGCRRSMETNWFHRASRYALECRRMAIGTSDELHERTAQDTEGHGRQDAMSPANHRARQCALEVPPEGVPTLNGNKLVPSRDLHFLKPLTHKKLLFLEPRDD